MNLHPTIPPGLPIDDTVRMPWTSATDFEERIVRPTLAILFRIAVGPGADHYCPRFLRYERAGRALPGWHWPAFFLPVPWAFYRRLWLSGILFALLPLVGGWGIAAVAPVLGDSDVAWIAALACAIWLFPGIVAALLANALVYRRTRSLVRRAEAKTDRKHEVATLLAQRRPTSAAAAVAFGGGALALALAFVAPDLDALHEESVLRTAVASSIAAVAPLQREIEANWLRSGGVPANDDYAPVRRYLGAALLDTVNLSPTSGRLRLLLGPALRDLAGKTILLAPIVDAADEIRWLCIPVDVPARFLPPDCANR